MCDFFSAIVDDEGKVYWKNGINSHSELEKEFSLRDSGHYAKVELNPVKFNDVSTWNFKIDEERAPDWWDGAYEDNVRQTVRDWMNSGIGYIWSGSLYLRDCDLEGVTLPQFMSGSLDINGCDLEGVTLPQSVGGWLDINGCKNIPEKLPKVTMKIFR